GGEERWRSQSLINRNFVIIFMRMSGRVELLFEFVELVFLRPHTATLCSRIEYSLYLHGLFLFHSHKMLQPELEAFLLPCVQFTLLRARLLELLRRSVL